MPLPTGQILNNRYRIVKLLGQGGFGAVYRAWDTNLNGPVAVKENFDPSPASQNQFAREASMLFLLRHNNLPRVIDHFNIPTQGQYLVMDFVEGEDLDAMLDQTGGWLAEASVLPWIEQVCDALAYMHAQNPPIIHRDIKPANIKITPQGQAMLVDFGIAKTYDPNLATTQGARAVTPGFSPNEQYGQGRTDIRSDVYALGATLYNLLTGQTPVESVQRTTGASLPAPRTLNPLISPSIEKAILKAMEISPAQRFQTIREFKAALVKRPGLQVTGGIPASAPISATPPAVGQLPSQKTGNVRLPVWVIIAIGVILLGCFGASGAYALGLFPKTTPDPAINPTHTRRPLQTGAPSGTSTQPVLPAPERVITVVVTANTPAVANSQPATAIPTPSPSHEQSPALVTLHAPNAPAATGWQQGKIAFVQKLSNDLRRIYTMDPPVIDAAAPALQNPTGCIRNDAPWWSADGSLLSFFCFTQDFLRQVYVVHSTPGSQPRLLYQNGDSPTWSPDGRQIVVTGRGTQLIIIDFSSGSLVRTLETGTASSMIPAWSPAGDIIAFTDQKAIYTIPTDGGIPNILTSTGSENFAPAWSPDGQWLAFQSDRDHGNHQSEIWIMDKTGGNLKQITHTPSGSWSRAPAWSPDQKWIVFVTGPSQIKNKNNEFGELFVINIDSKELIQITLTGGNVYDWRPSWGK